MIFKHRVKATKRKNETSKSTKNEPILPKLQKIQTPPPMTQNTSKAKNTSDTPKKKIIECIEIDISDSKPGTLRPVSLENLTKEIPKQPQKSNQELNEVDEVIDSAIICGSCSKSGHKSVISRCNICNLKCHLDCMVIVQNQKVCDGCKPIFV